MKLRDHRRLLLATLFVLATPAAVSYARAVLRPGHSSLRLRSGLWLRDHGMSWAVDLTEWCWYTLRRGHALHGLRPRGLTLSSDELVSDAHLATPLPEPHAIACSFDQCARGEGVWSASGARVNGSPAIYTTFFRPDVGHARVWAAASFMVYRDGRLDVRAWTQDIRIRHKVQAVRQNLDLIVDAGRSVDGLDRNGDGTWGRWNHGLYTWRSGLGIRPDGALVYVAGDGLTLSSLAAALIQTGCERGMELDIHDEWITFAFFGHGPDAGQLRSEKLLADMAFDHNRYLLPDDKDFVAVFAR